MKSASLKASDRPSVRLKVGDQQGADTLPLAFVASLLLTAAIVGLAATGMQNASPVIDSGSADVQAEALVTACQALLGSAPRYLDDPGSPAGASRIVELSLPASVECFELRTDGLVSYSVAGRQKVLVVEGASFRARGDGSLTAVLEAGPVTICGGRYRLEIEYAADAAGNRYLLVGFW